MHHVTLKINCNGLILSPVHTRAENWAVQKKKKKKFNIDYHWEVTST